MPNPRVFVPTTAKWPSPHNYWLPFQTRFVSRLSLIVGKLQVLFHSLAVGGYCSIITLVKCASQTVDVNWRTPNPVCISCARCHGLPCVGISESLCERCRLCLGCHYTHPHPFGTENPACKNLFVFEQLL